MNNFLVNLTSSQVQTFPLVISGCNLWKIRHHGTSLWQAVFLEVRPLLCNIYVGIRSGLVGGATDGGVKG